MFVPTLLCVTLAASSALPALAAKQYSRADLDDDMMFAGEFIRSFALHSLSWNEIVS